MRLQEPLPPQDKIMTKKQRLSENEFFYINTKFKFFGDPRNYSHLSDPDNDFNKNDVFEFKNNVFFKLSDLSDGKRTHYFTSTYNLKSLTRKTRKLLFFRDVQKQTAPI